MADDTISRQAALDFKVSHGLNVGGILYVPYAEIKKYLGQLPTAQPQRKSACLIAPHPYGKCSNCGQLIDIRDEYNYCPNCGADMRERSDNGQND